MNELPFQNIQQNFAAHLRDPAGHAKPNDVEERRMAVYRDLFFNNVRGFVTQAFPILGAIWGENKFESEIRQFWQDHACESPYFIHIAQAFLAYLASERTPKPDDPAFLIELAHYEWVELEIATRTKALDESPLEHDIDLSTEVALSSLAWPLQYQFPVHQISPHCQPEQAVEGGVFLVVYRDEKENVQFLSINSVTAQLLEFIQSQQASTGLELVAHMAACLPQYTEAQLTSAIGTVLHQLAQRGILCKNSLLK